MREYRSIPRRDFKFCFVAVDFSGSSLHIGCKSITLSLRRYIFDAVIIIELEDPNWNSMGQDRRIINK